MVSLKRPERKALFADIARNNPRTPLSGDLLDAQFQNLIDAIHSTQVALGEIRRDDGKLKNHSVGAEQLALELRHSRGEIDDLERRVIVRSQDVIRAANGVAEREVNVHLRAQDAENAAFTAAGFMSAINAAGVQIQQTTSSMVNLTEVVTAEAADAENWGEYAKAQADNAIKAKDEALQWAEYLAGPVVDGAAAPAYIADSPFPHGLYYQPVEGYGGNAGLWSSKWWAIYAAQLVGPWGFYYLGSWATAPMPGQTNPETGIKTPNPLLPGSFYYNTTVNQLYIWDGTQWNTPYVMTPAYQDNFVYVATSGQTIFSGADSNGQIPLVTKNPSDVHLNGIRLVPTIDYTIDQATSTLTLLVGATVDSIVQWDLLVETSQLAPGAISVFKLIISPVPDGANRVFTMNYNNPTQGSLPVAATAVAEIAISIDGIVQEPAVDFSISGATLTMATAPQVNCRMWGTWHASDLILP